MDCAGDDGFRPLWGLPVLAKDNIDVRGLATTVGSFALKTNIAMQDAPVIANLRRRSAFILGKTNTTELSNYTTPACPTASALWTGRRKAPIALIRIPAAPLPDRW